MSFARVASRLAHNYVIRRRFWVRLPPPKERLTWKSEPLPFLTPNQPRQNFLSRIVQSGRVSTATRPDESWMLQIARNVTDLRSGALHAKRFIRHALDGTSNFYYRKAA